MREWCDARLLMHADYDNVFMRCRKLHNDVSGLSGELGDGKYSPAGPALKMNVVLAEYTPDLMSRYISKLFGKKTRRPDRFTSWYRFIQLGKNLKFGVTTIFLGRTGSMRI